MFAESTDQLSQEIRQKGFFLAETRVDAATIAGLIAAFKNAETSDKARARKGETYALRNVLNVIPEVRDVATNPVLIALVSSVLGKATRPVKAILFDKTENVNWNLRWHQDTVISVDEKRDVPGFHGWSVKVGIPHVRPPVDILENMLAARIHVDDCAADNGALKVLPGSHASGRLASEDIEKWTREKESVVCTAKVGQILLMRPLLLHASERAVSPRHRRVLHIEYAGIDLPGGFKWGQ